MPAISLKEGNRRANMLQEILEKTDGGFRVKFSQSAEEEDGPENALQVLDIYAPNKKKISYYAQIFNEKDALDLMFNNPKVKDKETGGWVFLGKLKGKKMLAKTIADHYKKGLK